MKYYIHVTGCQFNEWDGARIHHIFNVLNLEESSPENADFIVILACSVRQTAVHKILGKINDWKKISGQKKIVVTGCVLESDRKVFKNKEIDIIKAGDDKILLETIGINSKNISKLSKTTPDIGYVPIINGCNNFCSYCAVPYTRGREKSRPKKEILKDVKTLIKKGHHQIMLLGQNVNSYKMDSEERNKNDEGKKDFTVLLEKLNDLEGDFIISFISSHPKDMAVDIIETVATLPKIKNEIHLPLQSGSDKILKAMNRSYTKSKYLKIVDNIKKIANRYKTEITLSTDVIVGFPGESEKDFQETEKVFKKVNFKYAFINKYSPRVGTKAYELGDPIPWSEKQRRWRTLNEIANK